MVLDILSDEVGVSPNSSLDVLLFSDDCEDILFIYINRILNKFIYINIIFKYILYKYRLILFNNTDNLLIYNLFFLMHLFFLNYMV